MGDDVRVRSWRLWSRATELNASNQQIDKGPSFCFFSPALGPLTRKVSHPPNSEAVGVVDFLPARNALPAQFPCSGASSQLTLQAFTLLESLTPSSPLAIVIRRLLGAFGPGSCLVQEG